MGFYISLEDSNSNFKSVIGEDGEPICDGKFVEGREIFSLIAQHSSDFVEFGDGDKRVRPTRPEEFENLREAIKDAKLENEEFALELVQHLEMNPSYYLTPSY